jgi:5-methylcytosine-specific restriction endonuclease McrA
MICKQCGNSFPSRIFIDGKERVLSSRKYCLDCSPFGIHNTKNFSVVKIGRKASSLKAQYVTDRRRSVKIKAILYKGGSCTVCKYNKCQEALEFHHRNPAEKDFVLSSSSIGKRSWDKVAKELDKCILVCANCHREIHSGLITVD